MAALPYMQLYIADYLADTMHLSTEEHGAYLLLMFNYWQTGRAIPKSRLGKIARLSNDRWISVEGSLAEFFNDNGTEWIHERIERDLEGVRSSLEQKSAAGRASALARKAKKRTTSQRALNGRSTGVEFPLQREGNENPTNKDPDKDTDIKHKNTMSGAEKTQPQTVHETGGAYPEGFEIFWSAYPKREGSNPKNKAYSAWKARKREGVPCETMLEGVKRYQQYCDTRGQIGTGYVMQAQRFLGPGQEFENDWKVNHEATNYGQNTSASGGSAANAVRAERERRERERLQRGGTESLGTMGDAGGRVWESLGNEEWVESFNAMGDADFNDDRGPSQ